MASLIHIVEDESIVALDIQNKLQRMGYEVGPIAASGEEAVKLAEEFRPDLVLMDIGLRGAMDGIEAAEQIRERLDLPIVFLTAYADSGILARAKVTEPSGYIVKPFQGRELQATIEMALYKHEVSAALQRRNVVLEMLNELSREVSLTVEVSPIMNTVARATAEAVAATSAYVCDWDEEAQTSTVMGEYFSRRASELERISDLGVTYDEPDGFVEWMRDPESVFVVHADEDPGPLFSHEEMEQFGGKSVLAVPLFAGDKGIGTLEVWESRRKREFTPEDIELVQTIARQVSMAIHNVMLYQELKTAYAEVQEADRLKTEMIHNISHEFRTPLSYVVGYVGLMLDVKMDAASLTDEQNKYLTIVKRAGERLTWLLDNFVTMQSLSRVVEKGQVPTDIGRLLTEEVETFELTMQDASVRLSLEMDDALPSVMVNPLAITQVVDNLLSNACKFTPDGGEVTVRAWHPAGNNVVRVSVSDTGIGISEEHCERIFDPFFQVDGSSTRSYGGTGLGLALCKGVVEAHGGEIWVDSQLDSGSTFTFTLPTEASAPDD